MPEKRGLKGNAMGKARVLAALLALCLAAHALPAGERPGTAYRVALAIYNLSPLYMQTWLKAAREHPAVESGLVKLTVYNGIGNQNVQDNQIGTIITLGYDAVVLVTNDLTFSTLMIRMLAQEGIPVVASCSQVNSDDIVSFIGSDDVEAGYLTARSVMAAMGGAGNVVIFKGPPEQGAAVHRDAGIARALAEFPGIRVLDVKSAHWSHGEAMQQMQQWLVNHHRAIDGVIAQNDEMALGALDAYRMTGERPPPMAGVDGMPEAVEAVKRGEMEQTLFQDAEAEAQGAIDIALRHLVGPDFRPMAACWGRYPDMQWKNGTEKLYRVPWKIIDKESAEAE